MNDFELETTTIWDFPDRGNWATHDGNYRGNWTPYVPKNLILRYSKKGDLLLDQFVGGGTTLVEAKLLGRNIIGVDVSENALDRCRQKCKFTTEGGGRVYIKRGNAKRLDFIKDNSIDFICTHPPYADVIKYSANEGDISNLKPEQFIESLKEVAQESFRVLKDGKSCAFLIGDIRRNRKVYPLGFKAMTQFLESGFELREIIIKTQHNCKMTDYWKDKSKELNFLLLAHEYLFVFKK